MYKLHANRHMVARKLDAMMNSAIREWSAPPREAVARGSAIRRKRATTKLRRAKTLLSSGVKALIDFYKYTRIHDDVTPELIKAMEDIDNLDVRNFFGE